MTFNVSFLGVRGTTPCASSDFVKYGGHTSCVMVEVANQIFFLDAGSGIINGNKMALQHTNVHLLFSHVHLDHVIGFPFFMPVWRKEITTNVYAGSLKNYGGIYNFLDKTFCEPLFPVAFKNFPGNIMCYDFDPGSDLKFSSDIQVQTAFLNHPNGAVGYRLNYQDKSMCYITDTEHMEDGPNQNILDLIQNTDLFIYDSTYNDTNYSNYKGWGHSTWQEAVKLGNQANVKKIIIFHHDPYNNDEKMSNIEAEISKQAINVIVSKQGMVINLL